MYVDETRKERNNYLFLSKPQIYHVATISCFVFIFVFISLKQLFSSGAFLCNLPFLQPMVQHSESSAQSK